MDAGFSNLAWLKRRLLLAADAAGSGYDEAVAALGLGVAAYFEVECGRNFARAEGDTYQCDPRNGFAVLPRYPLEDVTKLELRSGAAGDWMEQTAAALNFNRETGVATFYDIAFTRGDVARLTYTGGYWWDTSEDSTGTMPSGAEALPHALLLAWTNACKFIWDRGTIEERAKAGFANDEIERFLSGESAFPPFVLSVLAKYRRAVA